MSQASEIYFLNLSVEKCQENARNRAWEPHKYISKETQDKNLSMLLEWISDYDNRKDVFSKVEHVKKFSKKKRMITSNQMRKEQNI